MGVGNPAYRVGHPPFSTTECHRRWDVGGVRGTRLVVSGEICEKLRFVETNEARRLTEGLNVL